MPIHDLEAVFYAATAPGIEFREGMFHICYDVGRCRFEFAMPPNVFLKSLRNANKMSDQFQKGRGTVSPLRRKAVDK